MRRGLLTKRKKILAAVIIFGCLFAVVTIPHSKISIMKSRYYQTKRDMTESQVRIIMGHLAKSEQMDCGILYWDHGFLDEQGRIIVLNNELAKTIPKLSPRVKKTLIYKINALPWDVRFLFMFDAQGKLIGRHIHDYD